MADDTVQIRYAPTQEVREIAASAVPFFVGPDRPGWEVLRADGSVNPKPATPVNNADKKD